MKIAVFLGVVTLLEVLIYQWDTRIIWLYMGILIALALIKFITVVAFFMHLRFDGRLLTYIFCAGLVLAFIVFFVAITSLKAIEL